MTGSAFTDAARIGKSKSSFLLNILFLDTLFMLPRMVYDATIGRRYI